MAYNLDKLVRFKQDRDCSYTVDNEGRLHSIKDFPAIIIHKDGIRFSELWYDHGVLHRVNGGPARVDYFKSGAVMCEWWYDHGKIHRDEDLPAIERYFDPDTEIVGQRTMSFWYTHDKLNRSGGEPAVLHYVFLSKTKAILHSYWYENDKLIIKYNNKLIYDTKTIDVS